MKIFMKVFDFDKTIYDGESLFDFLVFCVRKKKSLCLHLPYAIYVCILHEMNRLSDDKIYALANKMARTVIDSKEDLDSFIAEFWQKNRHKLKKSFLERIDEEDVIITGSIRLLINGIASELKTKNIICSEYNVEKGEFEFICYGKNKVVAFNKYYPNCHIDEFYTDSLVDAPLARLADKAYLVKKEQIKEMKF